MKAVTITGKHRTDTGTKSAKDLRREGFVPCVIYGAGKDNVHFYTEVTNFRHVLYTAEAHLMLIEVEGETYRTIIRDAQFHPVTDELEHVDFYQFAEGKPITMNIPIRLVGNSRGVRNGGRLKVNMRKLPIKATEENMPGVLELNIEDLRIGQTLRASDIKTEEYEIMEDPNRSIVMVQTSRKAVLDVDEEEGEETETAEASEE